MIKTCVYCNTQFPTYDRRQKFCNSSCSARYNNTKRRKKESKPCENCGQPIKENASRFCSHKCQRLLDRKLKIQNGTYSAQTAKKHLLDIDNSCSVCKLKAEWNDKPLMMVLDHIDGNSDNNDLSNLRLVCPNCDSQLDTFKSRNRGNGRHSRKERYKKGLSY